MRRKDLSVLLLIAFLVLSLVACSTGNDQTEVTEVETNEDAQVTETTDEDVKDETEATEEDANDEASGDEVVISMLVPGYDTGYLTGEIDANIAGFEAENPNVKVEVIPVGWDELNSKIVQLYQAGEAPDLMLAGSRSIRQFAELGVLEDFTPYLSDDFWSHRIDSLMETGQFDGNQYGIPMAFSSRALFYRSDLIEKPPTNWDELLETARAVNEEHGIYGFGIPGDQSATTTAELLSFFYQGGGRVTDEAGNFVINSPENIATLEYLTEFADIVPNPVGLNRDDQATLFQNGDLAMFVSGAWEKDFMDEGEHEYGVVQLPAGNLETVHLITDSYLMSSISENKEEAAAFVEFSAKPENQRPISEAYSWFPVTIEEQEDERFKDEFMQPFAALIEKGTAEEQVPNYDEFSKSFAIGIQRALTGQATPEDALNDVQSELTK